MVETGFRLWDFYRGVDYIPGRGYTDSPEVILHERHPYLLAVPRPGAFFKQPNWFVEHRNAPKVSISINSSGFRGKEIKKEKSENTLRIACIGGSTTFDTFVSSDSTTWPARLESHLNKKDLASYTRAEVINAGVPGYTTSESLINLSLRVIDYKPDIIVVYHAWNDLKPAQYANFKSDYSHWRRNEPILNPKLYERSRLLIKLIPRLNVLFKRSVNFSKRRNSRLAHVLRKGEDAYRRNLTSIVAIGKSVGAQVILTSFAHSITKMNIQAAPDKLKNVSAYQPNLTTEAVVEGLQTYSTIANQVADENNSLFADVQKFMPQDFIHFEDHVHFTDEGAKKMAEIIGDVIISDYLNVRL